MVSRGFAPWDLKGIWQGERAQDRKVVRLTWPLVAAPIPHLVWEVFSAEGFRIDVAEIISLSFQVASTGTVSV